MSENSLRKFSTISASLALLSLVAHPGGGARAQAAGNNTAASRPIAAPIEGEAEVPPRGQESTDGPPKAVLSALPDAELWRYIEASGRTAVVGLKAPGQRRGVWKNKVLADDEQRAKAATVVTSMRGVTLLSSDPLLPLVTVRLADDKAMQRLRALPMVDYVEPAGVQIKPQSSGCDNVLWGSDPNKPVPFSLEQMRMAEAPQDYMPWNFGPHNIPDAWNKRGARGAGVKVAVVDTGIFEQQSQLRHPDNFAKPPSDGRTIDYFSTIASEPDPWDRCSHGTRMAGTIAAPRDGTNIVGVAWKANLASVKGLPDVFLNWGQGDQVRLAIRQAADSGAKIIAMAWGDVWHYNNIADEIRYHYYNRDILFFGAAGTEVCNFGVIFPARMEVVVAVTGLNTDGLTLHPKTCGGDQVDLAAIMGEAPAPGRNPGDVIHFGGSSDATALVAGVAALVWSEYPTMNRDFVRDRLIRTAIGRGFKDAQWGWGRPNAYAAVGGFASLGILGPREVATGQSYSLTANPSGKGPYVYRWSSGETTRSITKVAGAPGSSQAWTVEVTDTRENKKLSRSHSVKSIEPIDSDPCFNSPHLCQ